MRESIGVIELIEVFDSASVKQEALLFDRIAALRFNFTVQFMRERTKPPNDDYYDTLEWLFDKGIIFEPEQFAIDEDTAAKPDYKQFLALTKHYADKIRELADAVEKSAHKLEGDFIPVDASPLFLGLQYNVRLYSALLRDKKGLDAHPVIHRNFQSTENPLAKKSDIVQITLNALPVPDESIAWEQIIEYRSDPDSRNKFLDLRHWMSEVARGELTPIEVEEKLEYLISQYQRHMKIHKMKANQGVLQTIIVSPAELAENLIKFKWGQIAKDLFSIKQRKIALMEGELTSPGSEVAYIVKARETFSG
ncbi:MAG: hypothetical protein ICV60_05635 [Pyrinomonadaceae bacterium]|nr:hypothetical protein [Pyrinomonadaceae bacterium]